MSLPLSEKLKILKSIRGFDIDVAAEFSKEPMVVGFCDCDVGVCAPWDIPEYKDWDKLGLPDSDNGNASSSCNEGSGVFNTAFKNKKVIDMGLEWIGAIFGSIIAFFFAFNNLSNPFDWILFLLGIGLLIGGIADAVDFFNKPKNR